MKIRIIFLLAAILMSLPVAAQSTATENGVLVELFTSQGCSSCPPAEKLFNQIENISERAIPLAFHVDYWDYLGWNDSFASAEWTERQKDYGAKFDLRSIYTPQAVVAGRAEMNGADANAIGKNITKIKDSAVTFDLKTYAPSNGAKAGTSGLSIHASFHELQESDVALLIAITESKLNTHVRSGENTGRALEENHVVRRMVEAALLTPTDMKREGGVSLDLTLILDSAWKRPNVTFVVFAQRLDDKSILGAARVAAPESPGSR